MPFDRVVPVCFLILAAGCSGGSEPEADTTPPTVTLTSPQPGPVSGVVTVSAAASDASGIKGVDLYLNGGLLAQRDVTPPYQVTWDADAAGVGTFTFWAVAFDSADLGATSAEVTVTTQ
ncbi:MAG TPA: Ig-like domain-containing protein [Gemmatimonadales bacterium]|nr:Ig-like domain-containing protein [Gemmatimonadales bacterium]